MTSSSLRSLARRQQKMNKASALSFLVFVLNCLSSVFGESSTNSTITSGNGTETTSSTTEIPLLPNRTTEWEKRILFNLLIVGLVVLVFVGAVFIIRYMRTEKKSAKRKYERLSRAEDDDIELSIYEKK